MVRKIARMSRVITLKSAYKVPNTRRTNMPNVISDPFIEINLPKRLNA